MLLPYFFQSRLSVVSARIRAFASSQSSDNPFYHSSHTCQGAATVYKDDTDSPDSYPSKGHNSTPSNSRKATHTQSSAVAGEGDEVASSSPSGGVMATPDGEDDLRYEQFVRHLLRSVNKDADDSNNTRLRQTDARRLLEGPPLLQLSQTPPPHALEIAAINGQQRLPPNFNGQAHDAVDQRWSPSGIKWRYARQGAQLATDAANEPHDSGFERAAYIDAVAYYLRACPDELDAGETAKILSAAPWLARHPRPPPRSALSRPTDRGRTFLSEAVQYAVVGLILVGHMLWCLFLSAVRAGARLEREYQVSQRVATGGFDLVNSVGRHSVAWTARISAMNEGRIGQVVSWTMDSVTGGIQEGYGKGMDRIRRQANTSSGEDPHMLLDEGGIVAFRSRKFAQN